MFDAGSASDAGLQRSRGAARLGFDAPDGRPRIRERYGSAPLRILTPASESAAPEAVLANTSGGIAGGDSLTVDVTVGPAGDGTVAGQAAEKVYRSLGAAATIDTRLTVADGARLEWLPQETILFDGARLNRTIAVDLAPDASVLLAETLVFGRRAQGETFQSGALRDRWRIDRGGKPVWRDALVVAGGDPAFAAAPGFAGKRALATLIFAGPDAASLLEMARDALPPGEASGATLVRGLLVARLLAEEAGELKHDLGGLVAALRARAFDRPARPPRVWLC